MHAPLLFPRSQGERKEIKVRNDEQKVEEKPELLLDLALMRIKGIFPEIGVGWVAEKKKKKGWMFLKKSVIAGCWSQTRRQNAERSLFFSLFAARERSGGGA